MTPLEELELFCQQQIARLQSQADDHRVSVVINQTADVTPVHHAAGKRKPSLEDLDSQSPRLLRIKHQS